MIWSSIATIATSIDVNSLPHAAASNGTFKTVITVVLTILGAIALLFVTIGGLRYVISGGDPEAAAKAKNTIIYALVGLVVIILAQVIVQWVVGSVT